MRIFTDVDGVLADLVTPYLGLLNMLTGRRHSYADVTDFSFSKCVATPEEDAAVWALIDRSPGFVRMMAWHDGAKDGLEKLRTTGTVKALTAPHFGPLWMPERAHWLLGRGFTKKQVIFCSDKQDVPGDVLVEDCLQNAQEWQTAHPSGIAILLDSPYNQGRTDAIRVNDWGGAHVVIRGMRPRASMKAAS